LNNYFGRRGTIFTAAIILIATPIASGFTHNWKTLFVVRLILGLGMGAKGRAWCWALKYWALILPPSLHSPHLFCGKFTAADTRRSSYELATFRNVMSGIL